MKGPDMRIVAGTAGMPAEPFLPKVRNQIILDVHKWLKVRICLKCWQTTGDFPNLLDIFIKTCPFFCKTKVRRYSFVRNPKLLPILPEELKGTILMSAFSIQNTFRSNNSYQISSFWNHFIAIIGLFTLIYCWAKFSFDAQYVYCIE